MQTRILVTLALALVASTPALAGKNGPKPDRRPADLVDVEPAVAPAIPRLAKTPELRAGWASPRAELIPIQTPLFLLGTAEGATWATAIGVGTYIGGAAGYAIGDAVDGSDDARGQGAVTGALIGAGAGAITMGVATAVSPEWEPTASEPATMATTSAMGAFAGHELARTFIRPGAEDRSRRIALSTMLGTIGGTGAGILLWPTEPEPLLMADIAVGSFAGWQAAAGASDLAGLTDGEDPQERAPINLAGAAVGGVALGLLNTSDAPRPGIGTTALAMGHGTWLGAWAPRVFSLDPKPREVTGGLRLGLAGGYGAAWALASATEDTPTSIGLQVVGAATGNALGAGIPLAAGIDPADGLSETRAVLLPMLGAGVAGHVAGAALAPHYQLSEDDGALVAAMSGWTAYQAIGWTVYGAHADLDEPQQAGLALTAAGTGTLLTTGLAPVVEISPPESVLVLSSGAWGTWYSAWIGHLARLEPDAHWALTLSAGNATLLGAAAIGAGEGRADWTDVALVDGFGIIGGATGTLIAVIASPDMDAAAVGGLVGTTAGLGGGIALALRRTHPRDAATLNLPGSGRRGFGIQPSVQVLPWTAEDGSPGVFVSVQAREIAR